MRPRGNTKDSLWWLCRGCGSRWEWVPISKYEPEMGKLAVSNDYLTFGKYSGYTYQFVWDTDKSYCNMAMQFAEMEQASFLHKRFAEFLAEKERDEGFSLVDWEPPAGRLDMEL